MKEYYEAMQNVFDFRNKRGNPCKVVGTVKLHHFILKQVWPSGKSDCIFSFMENRSKNYLKFREKHFLKKKRSLLTLQNESLCHMLWKKIGKLNWKLTWCTKSSLQLLRNDKDSQKRRQILHARDVLLYARLCSMIRQETAHYFIKLDLQGIKNMK